MMAALAFRQGGHFVSRYLLPPDGVVHSFAFVHISRPTERSTRRWCRCRAGKWDQQPPKGHRNVRDTDHRRGTARQRSEAPYRRRAGRRQVPAGQQCPAAHRGRQLGTGRLAVRQRQLLGAAGHRGGRQPEEGRRRHRGRQRLHQ